MTKQNADDGDDNDPVVLWARRTGRILAFGAAAFLAYELGQFLKIW